MPSPSLEIKGLKELTDKLERLGDLKQIRPAMMAAALHVKGKIAKYPPFTEANVPQGPGSRWYERGKGAAYWRKRDNKKVNYGGSETLGRKWTVSNRDRGLTKVVGNNVSYGPYVQSAEKQAGFHERRGWKTDEDVIREEQDTVINFVKQEIDKILAS